MSTLTRRSSGNRVPDYKDYMSFVSAYRNGKKETDPSDDQNFIISTKNEKNMVPDMSGVNVKPCDSYSSFLEKTKTKKFGPVKPPLGPNEPVSKQTVKVKTEIFLEINDEVKRTPGKIELTVTDKNKEITEEEAVKSMNGQVEARKKIFEGRTQQENKLPVTNGQNQKNKILTLKQKLESCNTNTNEENIAVSVVPKETINKINKEKFETLSNHHKPETDTTENKIFVNRPVEFVLTNGCSKERNDFLRPQVTMTDGVQDPINFHIVEKLNNELQADIPSKETFIGQLNEKLKFKTSISIEPEKEHVEPLSEKENVSVKKNHIEESSIPPPPPPPMPDNFKRVPTSTIYKVTRKPNIQENNRENDNKSTPTINGSIQEADLDHDLSKKLSSSCQKSSTLERTNPLVRKLAYGAMLDMYGAYHEKANSYVSTLPRQHVKKDNGLQKIIDSIAAQGGLDHLSGRSNPKAENE